MCTRRSDVRFANSKSIFEGGCVRISATNRDRGSAKTCAGLPRDEIKLFREHCWPSSCRYVPENRESIPGRDAVLRAKGIEDGRWGLATAHRSWPNRITIIAAHGRHDE
jgi:hypothetical protein